MFLVGMVDWASSLKILSALRFLPDIDDNMTKVSDHISK